MEILLYTYLGNRFYMFTAYKHKRIILTIKNVYQL